MTNYEMLTRAMPKQLAELIVQLIKNPDAIGDEYCKQCPLRDLCPVETEGKNCTVSDAETVHWWLNQSAR